MLELAGHYWARGNREAGEVCAALYLHVLHSMPLSVPMRHHRHAASAARMPAQQANRASPLQAWCAKALDAERAALGPAHPFTIRTLQKCASCLGSRVGWQQASEMLQEHLTQLNAAGLGDSEGERDS